MAKSLKRDGWFFIDSDRRFEQWERGSHLPAPKKRMDKLDTVFSCPFFWPWLQRRMAHVDMKNSIGEANCRIYQESFSTTVTALSEAIDIYSEWIDECERVNNVEDDVKA